MSFGFSISDIVLLTQLTTRTYEGWRNACGDYASMTGDLVVLQTLLQRIEAEAKLPDSLFTRNKDDVKGWRSLSSGCRETVTKLAAILDKYRSLSTNRRRNWDGIRLGNKNLDDLGQELLKRIASLAAFASVTGVSSQARVENEMFPRLVEKMDEIAEHVRKGTGTIGTMTTYADDDKSVWREFRRDIRNAGFSSSDLRKHSSALRTHLAHLQREGLLDEDAPEVGLDEEMNTETAGDRQGDFGSILERESASEATLDGNRGTQALSEEGQCDGRASDESQAFEESHSRFVGYPDLLHFLPARFILEQQ
jgi:hypothetical protein